MLERSPKLASGVFRCPACGQPPAAAALLVTRDNPDDPAVRKQLNPDLDKYLK